MIFLCENAITFHLARCVAGSGANTNRERQIQSSRQLDNQVKTRRP